jgi:hypothetical protein
MAPWITRYAQGLLRFFGLANDSQAPNLGAFFIVAAFVLLAMGYKPEQMEGWLDHVAGLWSSAVAFAAKADNVAGIVLGFLGLRMMTPAQPGPQP